MVCYHSNKEVSDKSHGGGGGWGGETCEAKSVMPEEKTGRTSRGLGPEYSICGTGTVLTHQAGRTRSSPASSNERPRARKICGKDAKFCGCVSFHQLETCGEFQTGIIKSSAVENTLATLRNKKFSRKRNRKGLFTAYRANW